MIKLKTNMSNEVFLNNDFLQLILLVLLNKFHTWLTLKRQVFLECAYIMLAVKTFLEANFIFTNCLNNSKHILLWHGLVRL